MKGLKIFLKSLAGIPIGIFTLEVLNVILSLEEGTYIRLDGLANGINLESVILIYSYCSLYSYIAMVFINYLLKFEKSDLPIKERKKQINKTALPLIGLFIAIFVTTIIVDKNNYESIFGMCASVLWSFAAMAIGMVQNLLSRYSIKQINETLKKVSRD